MKIQLLLTASLALLVSACGGSGGSATAGGAAGAGGTNPTLPTTGATPNNQTPPFGNQPGSAACNSNPGCSPANGGGSCAISSQTCVDYTGASAEALSQFKEACAQNVVDQTHGRYSNAPCSTSNLVGSCKTEGGTGAESVLHFYGGAGMTSGIVQQACVPSNGNCAVYCAP
jgi:hypothetical protein